VLISWVLFPIAVTAVSVGCGLLLEHASRMRLPGALLAAAGFAVVLVAGHIATAWDATAELAVPVVLALAAAGYAASLPLRGRHIDLWALAAAAVVYAAFAAPVVSSGEPTFAGYVKLDDTATWLAITDRLMEHGRDLTGLADSTYEATLDVNLTGGYPSGAFPPLGIGAKLVGQDPAWVFQPYQALLAAYMALALYVLARRATDSRPWAALAAVVASQSALLFAYAMWGGVKELAAAWAIALLAALVVPLLRERLTWSSVLPLAAASAALLAVLSFGGVVWLAPVLLPTLVLLLRERGTDGALVAGMSFLVLAAVLSAPSLLQAEVFLKPSGATLVNEAELGNLIEPLSRLQIVGIWPVGDFRFEPHDLATTYVLIAVLLAAAAFGLAWAWRRRAWELILYVVAAAGGAIAISVFASPWVGAKALATGAPAVVLAGVVGAAALSRTGRRIEAVIVAVAIAGGVTWSNVLAYHEVNLAPRERHAELERIGEQIDGEGPTLMTEYEPYGARHFLRKGDAEGASELRRRTIPLRTGRPLDKLEVADVDQFDLRALLLYRTLVLRRSPVSSRPPSIYRRVRQGRFYDVWQRPPGSEQNVLTHMSLGGTLPSARPQCADVLRAGRDAGGQGGRLAVARRAAPATVALTAPAGSKWANTETRGVVLPDGDAEITAAVVLPRSGPYDVFVGGSFRGHMRVRVDGREIASERHRLSHAGQYEPLAGVSLQAGRHRVEIDYHRDLLSAGSGGPESAIGPLFFAAADRQRVELVPPARARSLCGQALDWVEAVVP
jgi:hypothetical protein